MSLNTQCEATHPDDPALRCEAGKHQTTDIPDRVPCDVLGYHWAVVGHPLKKRIERWEAEPVAHGNFPV